MATSNQTIISTLGNHLATTEKLPRTSQPQPRLTPTTLKAPSFLMNAPFSYAADIPNNASMQDLSDADRQVNSSVALRQFLALYHFISSRALVHLLPTPRESALQDLVFTANLGIVLDHLEDQNTVVLANFSSPPRIGETEIGRDFFKAMGYDVHVCRHKFEGEAELKHLHSNVYIGGYGERSQAKAYEWMEAKFDMTVTKLHLTNPYLHHLDRTVFPLTRQKTLVCTEAFTRSEIADIERHTQVIDVPLDFCLAGICNSVRVGNSILNASNIHQLETGNKKHRLELAKNRMLLDICADNGFEVSFFNLSEFQKGGAALSSMVTHLNRESYNFTLI